MEEVKSVQTEKEIVDIHPLKKGKRILVFLADFFIHFMITFVLFNLAVAPIGKAITKYDEKNAQHETVTTELYEHYYASGVLLTDGSFEKYDVTTGIEYTYRCFLSYFVLDQESSIDPRYPQYGHKESNDVVKHFYNDIRGDLDSYITSFASYNNKNSYFTFDDISHTYLLNNEVKNELYAYYNPLDEMGNTGKTYYNNILNNVFNPLMAQVFTDIEKNDLHYEGEIHSFVECRDIINSIEKYHENLMVICAYITHFISWLGCFLIYPLVNKTRQTLAMLIMKVERVDFYTLEHTKRPMYLINAFYYLFATLLGIMFIPSLLIPFNTLFTFRMLIYGTLFSVILLIADLIFLLINQYNRSLVDYMSNNLYLTEAEMNELYRARGYDI